MGVLVYSMMVSLDGFIEGPNRDIGWVIPDEELHTFVNDQARQSAAFLYGRRMYELMSGFWPSADADPSAPDYIADFARIWRDKPKIVFSRSLGRVEWNSRLVRDNVAEEITKLKQQPGGEIEVSGPNLASTVMKLGLIDEYRLFVHPVVLGAGTPFFPEMERPAPLRLIETRRFGSGVVYLRYQSSGGPKP